MNTLLLLALLGQSGYAGSPLEAIDAALQAASVTESDVVLDIGCGDGRVCVFASKKYGCESIGIELDKNLTQVSKATAARNGVSKLTTIIHGDALKLDLSKATVVYLYHQEEFMKMLRPQLEKLKPGTRVVCLDYPPPWMALVPVRTLKLDSHVHQIYLWTVGVCKASDSPVVTHGMIYPGVQFYNGEEDAYLTSLAAECTNLLVKGGVNGYWPPRGDGHPQWNSRFNRIRQNLGMTGVEVTAMSWPRQSESISTSILDGFYRNWSSSEGHWNVVSKVHAKYGASTARDTSGIWYATIIVAD